MLTALVVEKRYEQHALQLAPFLNSPSKVWSHSGYYAEHPRNSIKAFETAINLGAGGLEIDVYFDESLQEFVTSHDQPYDLFNGKIQTLTEVLTKFHATTFYWLDIKNLRQLSFENKKKAAQTIAALTTKLGIKNRVIVESKNAKDLSTFNTFDIATLYQIRVHHDEPKVVRWYKGLNIKWDIAQHQISALSIDYSRFGPDLPAMFKEMSIYLSTVNDAQQVIAAGEFSNIKVILTDSDFFHILN
tara:strand:- start:73 stop:807 length:735 start_codon:yes stop_codon:yes gene_type:complete